MDFASNGIRDAFEGQGEAGFVACPALQPRHDAFTQSFWRRLIR